MAPGPIVLDFTTQNMWVHVGTTISPPTLIPVYVPAPIISPPGANRSGPCDFTATHKVPRRGAHGPGAL